MYPVKPSSVILPPLSLLYGAVTRSRIALYQHNLLSTKKLSAPVISIGNITAGGTGKTPLTVLVAKLLAENGFRPCVLTRGYKRKDPANRVVVSDFETVLAAPADSGDEPYEQAHELKGAAAVIADRNRFAAGQWAIENLGANVFVLDDGFQHMQLRRNLDIVVTDATNPFGNGKLLPAGILREPLSGLKRADAFALTRTERANIVEIGNVLAKHSAAPIFTTTSRFVEAAPIQQTFTEESRAELLGQTKTRKAFAFCALGNPDNFFTQLAREGFDVTGTLRFPDHHPYGATDVEAIETQAKQTGSDILLTTVKDAAKLQEARLSLPCFALKQKLAVVPHESFKDLILNSLTAS